MALSLIQTTQGVKMLWPLNKLGNCIVEIKVTNMGLFFKFFDEIVVTMTIILVRTPECHHLYNYLIKEIN